VTHQEVPPLLDKGKPNSVVPNISCHYDKAMVRLRFLSAIVKETFNHERGLADMTSRVRLIELTQSLRSNRSKLRAIQR